VIVIGLALLALEFAWAERMLERAVDRMERARLVTREATRWQKIFGVLAVAAGGSAVIIAALYWNVPLLPF
jgi:Putative transmembrane protein (PGPGW)